MEFKFDVDEKRQLILVSWTYKAPNIEKMFHELGGEWEDFNVYRFPLSLRSFSVTHKTAKKHGNVRATKKAKEAVRSLKESKQRVEELTKGDSDAEISELLATEAPKTAEALRPYQRAGVKFISLNNFTLLADVPGAGKSLQVIASMISSGVTGDILVLAPSAAVEVTWPAEVERWAPEDEIVRVTGNRKQREEQLKKLKKESAHKRRWVLCNIEMARAKYHKAVAVGGKTVPAHYEYTYPELFFYDHAADKPKNNRLWSAIVCDESHRALITNKSQSHLQTQTRCGLGRLKVKAGGKKIAVSGTPFRGKLENLWGTLNWLNSDVYSSYWKWIDRWFDTEKNFFGGTTIAAISERNKTAFYEAIAPFTLRRTKSEISTELPPKMYAGSLPPGIDIDAPEHEAGLVGHWLEMDKKQKKAYDDMVEYAETKLENGVLMANGVLAELTRLKQFASCYGTLIEKHDSDGYAYDVFKPAMPSNKFNWLVEFLAELGIDKNGDSGPDARKVVVASQFTSVIDLYDEELAKLGIKTLKITGKVKGKDREAAVKMFQTDSGPQVFLLNTIAGGVSLTLDRADDIVILDETFIPDDQEQVEDRVHRVSRNHNVTIHYVRSLGTVEERIAKITSSRDNLQKELLDGERGVDFARKLLK